MSRCSHLRSCWRLRAGAAIWLWEELVPIIFYSGSASNSETFGLKLRGITSVISGSSVFYCYTFMLFSEEFCTVVWLTLLLESSITVSWLIDNGCDFVISFWFELVEDCSGDYVSTIGGLSVICSTISVLLTVGWH